MSTETLHQLLKTCFISGTSFLENGVRVNVKPTRQETILFFSIDTQTNSACTIRQDFKIQGRTCDLLVIYAQDNKLVICLIELKGKKIQDAGQQIINTYKYLHPQFKKAVKQSIKWKAYICIHHSAPVERKKLNQVKQLLSKNFPQKNWDIKREQDIGSFLRN